MAIYPKSTVLYEGITIGELSPIPQFTDAPSTNNLTSPVAYDNLILLAEKVVLPLKTAFKDDLEIISCYRTAALNTAMGGRSTSKHTSGQAIDFRAARHHPRQVVAWVETHLEYTGDIRWENHSVLGVNGGYIHVEFVSGASKGGIDIPLPRFHPENEV